MEQQQANRRRLVWIILSAVLVVVVGAGGAYWFFFRGEQPVQAGQDKVGPIYTVGDITTNLNESGRRAFIQVSITLEVEDQRRLKEIDVRGDAVRNEIIGFLRSHSVEEVSGEQGMRNLSRGLKNHLNGFVPDGGIKEVHFTEFVIQ